MSKPIRARVLHIYDDGGVIKQFGVIEKGMVTYENGESTILDSYSSEKLPNGKMLYTGYWTVSGCTEVLIELAD
jgi:hypothetical protein